MNPVTKRNFSQLSLRDVLQMAQRETLLPWNLNVAPRPPSNDLQAHLRRLHSFDLHSTEQAKSLLIDALLVEIVPNHPRLKVWKAAPLETETLIGVADYVIAPQRAYMATPLLCVAEAKRDDFERGRVQCIAEMIACDWLNRQEGWEIDVFGIVSNGQGWLFHKLARGGDLYETELYAMSDLPRLLGILDAICAECAAFVP